MRKKILCLVMAVIMTAGTALTAQAEDFKGNPNWLVDFDGDKMNTNFKPAEMSEEIYKLLPGDSIDIQMKIKNSGDTETDWYMTNETLQSLEESQSVAEGGAYTYELSYIDSANKETVFFSSEAVGGEGTNAAGEEGLHQATNSLEDYFYIDRLESGKSGTVHLNVKLDGETQGNSYQDTLAKLRVNFAVEKVVKPTIVKKDKDTEKVVKRYVTRNPRTGDNTRVLTICAVALASGLILLFLGISSAKRRRQDKKGE